MDIVTLKPFVVPLAAGPVPIPAAAECVALRARAGDPENQSQGIMQSAVILQWD